MTSILDSNEYTEFQAGAWNAGNSRMRLFLNDDKKARRPQSEIARVIQVLGNEYPDLRVMVFEPQSISTQRGGLPVQFVLQAPNIEVLRNLVPKFEEAASKSPVFSVVNSNLRFTKPELHIEILRDKANEEGVSVNDIAQAVQLAISDQTYGDYYKDGRQYDIIGAVGYQYRDTPENLSMLTVKNGKGELVSLDNFITYKEQSASPSLPRYHPGWPCAGQDDWRWRRRNAPHCKEVAEGLPEREHDLKRFVQGIRRKLFGTLRGVLACSCACVLGARGAVRKLPCAVRDFLYGAACTFGCFGELVCHGPDAQHL